MKGFLKIFLGALIFLVGAGFAVFIIQNLEPVHVEFLVWRTAQPISLAIVTLVAFAVGATFPFAFVGLLMLARRRDTRAHDREVKVLTEELHSLRNQALTSPVNRAARAPSDAPAALPMAIEDGGGSA